MLCCFGRLANHAADVEHGLRSKTDQVLPTKTAVVNASRSSDVVVHYQTAAAACSVERDPNTSKKLNLPPSAHVSRVQGERWIKNLLEQLSLLAATERLRAAGCWVVAGHRGKCFLLAQAPASQTAIRASLLGCSVGASISFQNDTETSVALAIRSKAPVCMLAPAQGQPPFWPSDHRQLYDRLHQADGGSRNEPGKNTALTTLAWRLLTLPLLIGDEVCGVLAVTELADTVAGQDGQRSCSPPEQLIAASHRIAQEFFGNDEGRAYALRLCDLVDAVAEAPTHDAAIRSAAFSIHNLISAEYTHLACQLCVTCGLVLPARSLLHPSKCGTGSTSQASVPNPGGAHPYITSPHTGSPIAATAPHREQHTTAPATTGSTLHLYCSKPIAVPTQRTLLACEPVRADELAALLTEALAAPVSSTAAAAAAAAASRTSGASLGPGPGRSVGSGGTGGRPGGAGQACGPHRQPHHKRLALRCPEVDDPDLRRSDLEALEAVGARCPGGSVILASCPLPSTLCAVVVYVCVAPPPPGPQQQQQQPAGVPIPTAVVAGAGRTEASTERAAVHSGPCERPVSGHSVVQRGAKGGDQQQQPDQLLSDEQLESILQHVTSAVEVMAGALEQRLVFTCLPQHPHQHHQPGSLAPSGGRAVGVLDVAAEPQGLLTVSLAGTDADDSTGFWGSTSGPFLSGVSTPSSQLPLVGSLPGSSTARLYCATATSGPPKRPVHGTLLSSQHHAAHSTLLQLTCATTLPTDSASGPGTSSLGTPLLSHNGEAVLTPGEAEATLARGATSTSVTATTPDPCKIMSSGMKEQAEGEEGGVEDVTSGVMQVAAPSGVGAGPDVQGGSAVAVGPRVRSAVAGSPDGSVTNATVDLERRNPTSTGGQRLSRLGLDVHGCGSGRMGAASVRVTAACGVGGEKWLGREEDLVSPTGVAVFGMEMCSKEGEGDMWDDVADAAESNPVKWHHGSTGRSGPAPQAMALAASSGVGNRPAPPPPAPPPAASSDGGSGGRRLRSLQVLSLDKAALQLQRPRNSSSPTITGIPPNNLHGSASHWSPGRAAATTNHPDAATAAALHGCSVQLQPPPLLPPAPHPCPQISIPHAQRPQLPQPLQTSLHPQSPQPQPPPSSHRHPGGLSPTSCAKTPTSPLVAASAPSATPPPLPYVPFVPRRLNRMYLAASSGRQQPLLSAAAVTAAAAGATTAPVGNAHPAHVVATATVVAGPFIADSGALPPTAAAAAAAPAPHDDDDALRAAAAAPWGPRGLATTVSTALAQAATVVSRAPLPDFTNTLPSAASLLPPLASAGPSLPPFAPTSISLPSPCLIPSTSPISPPPQPQSLAPHPRPAATTPIAHPLPSRSSTHHAAIAAASQPIRRQLSGYAIPEDAPLLSNVTETVAMMRSLSTARGSHLSARMGRLRLTAKIQSAHLSALPPNLPSRLEQLVGASLGGGGSGSGSGGGWVLTSVAARRGCIELVCDLLMTRTGSDGGDPFKSDGGMCWDQGMPTWRRSPWMLPPPLPLVWTPPQPQQHHPHQLPCRNTPASCGATSPGEDGELTPPPSCSEQHWLELECGLRPEALGGLLERCGLLSPTSDQCIQVQLGHSAAGVAMLMWEASGGGHWVACRAGKAAGAEGHAIRDGEREEEGGVDPSGSSGELDDGSLPLEAPVLWLPCPVVMTRGSASPKKVVQLQLISMGPPCSAADKDEVTVRCASGYLPCRVVSSAVRTSDAVEPTRSCGGDDDGEDLSPSDMPSTSVSSPPPSDDGICSLPEDEPILPPSAAAAAAVENCTCSLLQVAGPLPPYGGLLLVECRRTRTPPSLSATRVGNRTSAAAAVDCGGAHMAASSRNGGGTGGGIPLPLPPPPQLVTSPPVPLLLLPVEHWAAAAELRQLRTHLGCVLLPPPQSPSHSPRCHAADDTTAQQQSQHPQRAPTDGSRRGGHSASAPTAVASTQAAVHVEMACQQLLMDLGLLLDAAAAVRGTHSHHQTPSPATPASLHSSISSSTDVNSNSGHEEVGKRLSFAGDMQALLQPRQSRPSSCQGEQNSGCSELATAYDDYLMDVACTLLAGCSAAGLHRTAAMVLRLACDELALGLPEVLMAGLGPIHGSSESWFRQGLMNVRRQLPLHPDGRGEAWHPHPSLPLPVAVSAHAGTAAARPNDYGSCPSVLAAAASTDLQPARGPRREGCARDDVLQVAVRGSLIAAAAPICCSRENECSCSTPPACGTGLQPPAGAAECMRCGCGCRGVKTECTSTAAAASNTTASSSTTSSYPATGAAAAATASVSTPLNVRIVKAPPCIRKWLLSGAVVSSSTWTHSDHLTPPDAPAAPSAVACNCGCGECRDTGAAAATTTITTTSTTTADKGTHCRGDAVRYGPSADKALNDANGRRPRTDGDTVPSAPPSGAGGCSWVTVYGGLWRAANTELGRAEQDRRDCGWSTWMPFIPLLLPLPYAIIYGGLVLYGSTTGLVRLLSSKPQAVLVLTLIITALCLLFSVRRSRTAHTSFTGGAGAR